VVFPRLALDASPLGRGGQWPERARQVSAAREDYENLGACGPWTSWSNLASVVLDAQSLRITRDKRFIHSLLCTANNLALNTAGSRVMSASRAMKLPTRLPSVPPLTGVPNPPGAHCERAICAKVEWTPLAHINRHASETQSRITKEWIQDRLKRSRSYTPKTKWGIRAALKKIPKRKAAVFIQLASGHALIGTHLVRIKKTESNACWWRDSGRKQSRAHLFGGCRAWKRECLTLKTGVERIC
jgi:hypothetical protein